MDLRRKTDTIEKIKRKIFKKKETILKKIDLQMNCERRGYKRRKSIGEFKRTKNEANNFNLVGGNESFD